MQFGISEDHWPEGRQITWSIPFNFIPFSHEKVTFVFILLSVFVNRSPLDPSIEWFINGQWTAIKTII